MKNLISKNPILILVILMFGSSSLLAQTDKVDVVLGIDTTLTVEAKLLHLNQPNENTQIGIGISTSHTGSQIP